MKIFRLKKDDKLVAELIKKIDRLRIKSGVVIGVGALSSAELMMYDLKNKKYFSKKIKGAMEVGSFTAIVTRGIQGETHIHPHIVVSDSKFKTFCGHLKEGIVAATFEAVLFPSQEIIERYKDTNIGLNLIK
jgi:predicted DNA-binding protein with PD1-like motif